MPQASLFLPGAGCVSKTTQKQTLINTSKHKQEQSKPNKTKQHLATLRETKRNQAKPSKTKQQPSETKQKQENQSKSQVRPYLFLGTLISFRRLLFLFGTLISF